MIDWAGEECGTFTNGKELDRGGFHCRNDAAPLTEEVTNARLKGSLGQADQAFRVRVRQTWTTTEGASWSTSPSFGAEESGMK